MAGNEKKNGRAVYQALYESEVITGDVIGGRRLFIVAPSWIRAVAKAVGTAQSGETLVSVMLAKDAVI